MKKQTLSIIFTSVVLMYNVAAYAHTIDWQTNEGISRLDNAEYKHDLLKLAPQFEGQINKVYCGIASSTIVLNALRVDKNGSDIPVDSSGIKKEEQIYFPKSNGWTPFWKRYTQNTVVNYSPKARINIFGKPNKPNGSADYGLHLMDEVALLSHAELNVKATTVTSLNNITTMKQEIINALKDANQYVIINYLRTAVGQSGDGHFSPLGAYDKKSDSFLIMDVSNTHHSWVWVDSVDMFRAMNTIDGQGYRGYLIVKESKTTT